MPFSRALVMAQFSYRCSYVKVSNTGDLYECDRPARGMFCEEHQKLWNEVEETDREQIEYFKKKQ